MREAIEAVARIKGIDRLACRRHVEQYFTVERMVDKYIKVYEKILQDSAVCKMHKPIITRLKKNPILIRVI